MNADAETFSTGRFPVVRQAPRLAPWLVLAALFAVAVVLRHVLPANADVSWLLTVAERVWDGQRLYVDIIETNPPMAVWTYIPGIAIARALGLPAEMVTDALVFAAIFASLALAARILKDSAVLGASAGWPLAWLAFAILAVLPTKIFGQREHIAVLELLPVLALYAARMKGRTPPLPLVLAAGVAAGVALSFKPHFAIGMACGLAALAVHARSWRILFAPENFIAAAIVVIYALCIVLFYPEFLSAIAPLVRDIYIRVGSSFIEMIETPAVPIWDVCSPGAEAERPDRQHAAPAAGDVVGFHGGLFPAAQGLAVSFLPDDRVCDAWPRHCACGAQTARSCAFYIRDGDAGDRLHSIDFLVQLGVRQGVRRSAIGGVDRASGSASKNSGDYG